MESRLCNSNFTATEINMQKKVTTETVGKSIEYQFDLSMIGINYFFFCLHAVYRLLLCFRLILKNCLLGHKPTTGKAFEIISNPLDSIIMVSVKIARDYEN